MQIYKRALITGATSGIGEGFASELPRSTALLIVGRNEEKLDQQKARLAHDGRMVETIVADLGTFEGIEKVVAAADAFEIDLLINNAGAGRLGSHLEESPESVRETVMVNVVTVAELTRRLVPGMLARVRGGSDRCGLIIVSSTAAFLPVPRFATYAASKAFDLHYAEALAEELSGEPIDVLALCPGATRTAFNERAGARWPSFPLASDPRAVAREAMAALGRETILVTGLLDRGTFGIAARPRPALTRAIGAGMRLLTSGGT